MGCKPIKQTNGSTAVVCTNDVDSKTAFSAAVNLKPDEGRSAYCSAYSAGTFKNYCRYADRFWVSRSLPEGFAELMGDVSRDVKRAVAGSNSAIQTAAGTGVSLANLAGTITLGMADWAAQVVKEVPKGPNSALYKLVAIPVTGAIHGIKYVGSNVESWTEGSLSKKGSYDASNEVTATLGTAALILLGMKSVVSGAGKAGSGLASSLKNVQNITPSGGAAVLVHGAAGAAVSGGGPILTGLALLAAADKKGGGSSKKGKSEGSKTSYELYKEGKIPEYVFVRRARSALLKHNGSIGKAAQELGAPVKELLSRVTYQMKTGKGKSSGKVVSSKAVTEKIPVDQIEAALAKHGGEIKGALTELGFEGKTVQKLYQEGKICPTGYARFINAALKKHGSDMSLVAPEMGIKMRVKVWEGTTAIRMENIRINIRIAEALEKHGNITKAAEELGLSVPHVARRIKASHPESQLGVAAKKIFAEEARLTPAKLSKRINRSRPGSPLYKYSDAGIAEVLNRHNGDVAAAASELGIELPVLVKRISKAEEGSPLSIYKELLPKTGEGISVGKVVGSKKVTKISSAKIAAEYDQIAAVLEKHGSIKKAADELGLSLNQVRGRWRKAKAAYPDSKLAKWKPKSK